MDLGDAAVFGVAEPTDQGDDVEAEFVVGQGEVGFGLGPVGSKEAGTIGVVAAADREGQPGDAVEGGDGAEVVVVGMGPMLTLGTMEGVTGVRVRARSGRGRGVLRIEGLLRGDSLPPSTSPASAGTFSPTLLAPPQNLWVRKTLIVWRFPPAFQRNSTFKEGTVS